MAKDCIWRGCWFASGTENWRLRLGYTKRPVRYPIEAFGIATVWTSNAMYIVPNTAFHGDNFILPFPLLFCIFAVLSC